MLSSFNQVQLFASLWTVDLQAPLSMGFPRQEYWSGLPFPSPGDLSDQTQGSNLWLLMSPAVAGGFFTTSATWETQSHPARMAITQRGNTKQNKTCKYYTDARALIANADSPKLSHACPLVDIGNSAPSSLRENLAGGKQRAGCVCVCLYVCVCVCARTCSQACLYEPRFEQQKEPLILLALRHHYTARRYPQSHPQLFPPEA